MNSVLGTYYNSIEQTIDLGFDLDDPIPTVQSILYPVAAKFCRAKRRESSPFYDWSYMHLSLLHTSSSTLDIMIQKKLLNDIPSSLNNKHSFDCFCHICALRKAKKLPCGKPVDKSNHNPFERIHMDFEFFGSSSI